MQNRHFEFANKPGRWLAYKIRIREKMITKIQENNVELVDNKKKLKAFHNFFSNLYEKQEISLEKN